jgi:hypothetical protein
MAIQKITDNMRNSIFSLIFARLETIRIAGGYNTSPIVTTEPLDNNAKDTPVVWVSAGSERFGDAFTNRQYNMDFDIIITGYVTEGHGNIQLEMNKLLQDVRSCIHNYVDDFQTAIGSGTIFKWGDCETDEGMLLAEGMGMFAQPITITYRQGVDW